MLQQTNNTFPKPVHRLRKLLGLLILAVVVVLLVRNSQRLDDWWRLRGYQPPAAVVQLTAQDTMNSYTQHLFYLNRPQLLNSVSSFRKHCPENKNTIVLGCYHPGQNGIFIYNVSDPSLAGLTQVTAAHEVLHAVYARLSDKQRQQLDNELEAFYKHGLNNTRVEAEVKLYQQTEPHDVYDEMSCTFGTEVAHLPPVLEAYYDQFFTNRAAIVAYEQSYEGEFTSRQAAIKEDDGELASLKQQIDSQQSSLTAQRSRINAENTQLSGLLTTGQDSAYNAAVPGYNTTVDDYNAGVDKLQSAIDNYNQLVAARNAIAGQLTTLDSAIDTRLTTQSPR